jgi:hypothetical protein
MKIERKRSIGELEDMRREVERLHGFGRPTVESELILQTYLMSGTDLEELKIAADRAVSEHKKLYEDARRKMEATAKALPGLLWGN